MKIASLLVIGVALIALDAAAAKPRATAKVDPNVAFVAHAHELVAGSLLDPPSARFSNQIIKHDDAGKVKYLCGFVQGKNSFGGYAQPAIFAVEPDANRTFIGHNVLRPEDTTSPEYGEGIKFLNLACGKDQPGDIVVPEVSPKPSE